MIGAQRSIPTSPEPTVSPPDLARAGRLHSSLHDLLNHPAWAEAFEPHVSAAINEYAQRVLEDRTATDEDRRQWLHSLWALQDLFAGLSQKHAEAKRAIVSATNQDTPAAPLHPLAPAAGPVYRPPKIGPFSVDGLLQEFRKDFNPFASL